jgi:unsaturated rhamnogalacturonyl hydrolase
MIFLMHMMKVKPIRAASAFSMFMLISFLGTDIALAQGADEVARKVALNTMGRKTGLGPGIQAFAGRADISYPMVCSRYGVLLYAGASGDQELLALVKNAYQPFLSGKTKPRHGHVDYNVFGILPFELYRQTRDPAYLPLAKKLADDEFSRGRQDGLSDYTRFWVDDMYMVGSLQTQAYKALGDRVYLDRAFRQLLAYCAKLQSPNGLFQHNLNSPYFWGRGNGWAAASMTELLLAAPADHPDRPALFSAYQKLMKALVERQNKNGLWHQLLDRPESYIETSSSGMFVFALATGVRKGWLPADPYRGAAERAWRELVTYVDPAGNVREVCVGTSAINSREFYLNRPRQNGDLHGHAGFLWAAAAMKLLETDQK